VYLLLLLLFIVATSTTHGDDFSFLFIGFTGCPEKKNGGVDLSIVRFLLCLGVTAKKGD